MQEEAPRGHLFSGIPASDGRGPRAGLGPGSGVDTGSSREEFLVLEEEG